MNIGIDIDDTINNLHDILAKSGTEFNKKNNIDFKINLNEWDWDKAFGWDDELANRFLQENIEFAYLNASIKKDAAKVINKLHSEGNKIIIVTSRSKVHYKDPYIISKTWLNEKNVKFDELIVEAQDKASICTDKNIDIFIDDHVEFCKGVSKTKTKVLMFDSPYNKKEKGHKRVYSWNEVYENIVKNK